MTLRYLATSLLASLANAVLDKPALHPNLGYCNQGLLDNLHPTPSTNSQWSDRWIPNDCAFMAKAAGLEPHDVDVWDVQYSDCDDPWILCRHIDAPDPISKTIELFGRLPVGTRQWVRHIITLPDSAGPHAYNLNGNIALFGDPKSPITLLVHEAGHSLDLQGALTSGKPLSSSQDWLDSYNKDSHVPDPYARSNQRENLAQMTVVSMFNLNVPNGFRTVEPKWRNLFNQYFTLAWAADGAGHLLKPGGVCTHRLANSSPIPIGTRRRTTRTSPAPNVELSSNVTTIVPSTFDTRKLGCAFA